LWTVLTVVLGTVCAVCLAEARLAEYWIESGNKEIGKWLFDWVEVFGVGSLADTLFGAWYNKVVSINLCPANVDFWVSY
jgi:hypothetical protein